MKSSPSRRRQSRTQATPDLRAAALLAGMSDAFFVLDEEARFTLVNPRAEQLLGQPADELVGTSFGEVFDGHALDTELSAARHDQQEVVLELYFELSDSWLELRIVAVDEAYYVFFKDITDRRGADRARVLVNTTLEEQVRQRTVELERANAKLVYDAFHDALTGLPNRSFFMDRLEQVIQVPRRGYAVLFLDFDRFKVVNDSLGHLMGDELLISLGRQLRGCLRQGDTLARLGGDEFIILLEDIDGVADATEVAKRIQGEFSGPLLLHGHEIHISASIGVVCGGSAHTTASDVFRDADVAMYRAKTMGKACYAVFDTAMRERVMALVAMETDLRSAIERRQLEVHYQPVLQLPDGKVTGLEALVRWHHPRLGFVPPSEFIPIAEEAGLIYELDMLVLRAACRQMARWHSEFPEHPPRTLSVNVSGKQLLRPNLAKSVETVLWDYGLAPGHLCLEITEGVLMDNTPVVRSNLRELEGLGVHLHIDDFGMGYSSLSYLQRFPAHRLKIDRSFIDQMTKDDAGLELVRTMITMAHNLNMGVVAEGVETAEQHEALCALGCDYVQGYLFGRPKNAAETSELLARYTVDIAV